MNNVSFYGGETTGGVGDRRIDTTTAKQETTGGVGVRKNKESIFTVDNDLQQDTVCFRGKDSDKKGSVPKTIAWLTAIAAAFVILAGCSKKYGWVEKIPNENAQKILEHTNCVTEPCYNLCKWVKENCYEKAINLFRRK